MPDKRNRFQVSGVQSYNGLMADIFMDTAPCTPSFNNAYLPIIGLTDYRKATLFLTVLKKSFFTFGTDKLQIYQCFGAVINGHNQRATINATVVFFDCLLEQVRMIARYSMAPD